MLRCGDDQRMVGFATQSDGLPRVLGGLLWADHLVSKSDARSMVVYYVCNGGHLQDQISETCRIDLPNARNVRGQRVSVRAE